jgi:hypothetical protein
MVLVPRVGGAAAPGTAERLAARARELRFPVAHAERVSVSAGARGEGGGAEGVQVSDVRWYRALGYAHVLKLAADAPRERDGGGDGTGSRGAAPGGAPATGPEESVAPRPGAGGAGEAAAGAGPAGAQGRAGRGERRAHRAAAAYQRAMSGGLAA